MRQISKALAILGLVALAGCYTAKPPAGSGTSKGVQGQYYFVNLFTPPTGGVITSSVGGIDCGVASVTVNNAVSPPQYVYAYYPSGAGLSDHCGQNKFLWGQTVILTATPHDGNAFLGWAGDCTGSGTCTLTAGLDKTVVALFGVPGSGHANFMDPAVHGPAFFGSVSNTSALHCATCHGPTLDGQGIAPSCNGCHAAAGWVGPWQSNCSFCHGTKDPLTKAGYAFAAQPAWAAPPDAISQRLSGMPAPDRTGAHQAHLTGVTPSGLSAAGPFQCATCHPVPSDLGHIKGAPARAQLVLSGAGQGSLPASLGSYDQASGTCATYCHGPAGSPAWSATGMKCDGCHGVAPLAPHPYIGSDLTTCSGCHPDSVNPDGSIKAGGKHLDGLIQASGGHSDYSLPSVHGPAYLDFLGGVPGALSCTGCHGTTYDGGVGPSCNSCHAGQGWTGWRSNCSFCHGTKDSTTKAGYAVATSPTWSAPPDAIAQRLDPTHAAVPARTGAHQAHLTGLTSGGLSFAQPFACATCHAVPTDLSHVGGSTSRATVALSGAGQASFPASLGLYDQATGSCTTSCHGTAPSPAWSAAGSVVCGTCHALPPAASSGHPTVTGGLTACATCHPDTMNADGTLNVAGGRHLDGLVEASGGHADFTSPATHGPQFFDFLAGAPGALTCTACHGKTYDGGLGPSCNACHAGQGWTAGWQTNCSFCHGTKDSSTQAGYAVAQHPTWSAPPDAIAQRLDPAHAAVPARTGAHQAHLAGVTAAGKSFAAPFTCATCHLVPSNLSHIGGSASRATVTLSGAGQASLPASLGTYDQASASCTTSCHGAASAPVWSAIGSVNCGSCHALPPAPATGHPTVSGGLPGCAVCHPETVKADGTLDLAGGKHLDGVVEASGMHGDFASPATHGPKFFDYLAGSATLDCKGCHGPTFDGGVGPSCNACHAGQGWTAGWQDNCSFCHGTKSATTQAGYAVAAQPTWSAPPDAIAQRLDPAHAPVPARTGAHQAHLSGATAGGLSFARPFACATCHAVPGDLSHIGGSTSRATVALSGAGQAFLPASLGLYDQASGSCTTKCHGTAPSPAWSSTGLVCGACHALPPAPASGHPTVPSDLTTCSTCHPATMNGDGTLNVAGGAHLDGQVEVTGMHGNYASPATHGPRFFDDLAGNSPLDCQTCHGKTYDGGVGPSCNACHAGNGWSAGWQTNCSFCHGTRDATTKAGYAVAAHPTWSAPPDAIAQRLDPAHAAVPARTGAHQAHLTGVAASGAALAQPFLCATCHAVPSDLSHIGGSASRATVALSGAGQAALPASLGSYDQASGSCTTQCHGTAPSPAWANTNIVCGTCHALPPAPASGHPAITGGVTTCSLCHPATVKADGTIDVAGGKHVDGLVESSGMHPDFSSPAVHGPAFLDRQGGVPGAYDCAACHGASYGGVVGPSCNACHTGQGWTSWSTNCSFCHGQRTAASKAGYPVASQPTWSAPPDAITQRLTGVAAPARTGAHLAHLSGATAGGLSFALPFACATCHAVPGDLSHIGGSSSRATVALTGAGQGSLPASLGSYDQASGSCTTQCHGSAPSPAWSSTGLVCGACHALPPAPATGHPTVPSDLTTCTVCHPATMRADGSLDVPGGKHLDGAIEVTAMHGDFSSVAVHGPAALDFLGGNATLDCKRCHGASYGGGVGPSCNACHASNAWSGWQTNCSFCHGTKSAQTKAGYAVASQPTWSAPPDAIAQRLTSAPDATRTGAHQAHLSGATAGGVSYALPFACATCHAVPADTGHVRSSTARATVALSGAGQAALPAALGSYDQASGSCTTQCHGSAPSPAWSASGAVTCGTCHALPPAPATGHPGVPGDLTTCAVCHPDTVNADGSINVAGGKHLDGAVEVIAMHGDFSSVAVHGPAALDFLGGNATLDCRRCHGATFDGGVGPSCNACHSSNGWTAGWQTSCSFCHGTKSAQTKAGYALGSQPGWSAPPDAIAQRLDPAHAPLPARTGAHQAHLSGATAGGLSFALPFACATCHAVPADTGHVRGSTVRATVALSGAGQGSLPASLGSYDQASGSCNTQCHGSAPSPAWSSTGLVCGACHALPPSAASGHPSVPATLTLCSACHPDTMNADGTLNVAGGKHLDGKVEASGGHPDWSAPATHGQHFFAYLRGTVGELNCTTCHGATFDGGLGPSCTSCHSNTAGWTADWRTNCSFCHGTRNATTKTTPYSVATSPTLSAPPDALSQRLTGVADPTRSGAHQAHLTGKGSGTGTTYSAPIACGTCHTVPADYQHAGGPGRAPVVLKGLSGSLPASLGSYSADSGTCATYCHGATMANPTPPAWNGGELGCTGCHGNPPLTGQHDYHVNQMGYWCADCHTNSVTYPPPYIGVKHLNGKVDVDFYSAYLPASKYSGGTCSTVTCHPFSYPVTW